MRAKASLARLKRASTVPKVASMSEARHDVETGQVVRLETAQAALRDHFLGWQCRLRQLAVREAGGRPSSGIALGLSRISTPC